MRTRITSTIFVLLLAAVLTVGAAWFAKLFYLFVDVPYTSSGLFWREDRLFTYYAWELPGRTSVTVGEIRVPNPTLPRGGVSPLVGMSDFVPPAYIRLPTGEGVAELATGAYGFPFRCLKGELVMPARGASVSDPLTTQLLLSRTFKPQGRAFSIPWGPIWPGLAGNIVFWSLAVVAWRVGPRWVRGRSRRARGLCPSCGYDLSEQREQGCPECGWARAAQDGSSGV